MGGNIHNQDTPHGFVIFSIVVRTCTNIVGSRTYEKTEWLSRHNTLSKSHFPHC